MGALAENLYSGKRRAEGVYCQAFHSPLHSCDGAATEKVGAED